MAGPGRDGDAVAVQEVEAGDGLAEHGRAHPDVVKERAATHGGDHADGDGEAERQEQGGGGERERGRKPLEHQPEGIALVAQRLAEVPPRRARHEAGVLNGQRVIEAEPLAEFIHVLRLDIHGEEEQDRISSQTHQEEDGGEREEHH